MNDDLRPFFLDEFDEGLDLRLGSRVRSGEITRSFGFGRPVLRGKIAIEIDTPTVHALLKARAVGIDVGNQDPVFQRLFKFERPLNPRQQIFGKSNAFRFVSVNATDKKQRMTERSVVFSIQRDRRAEGRPGP